MRRAALLLSALLAAPAGVPAQVDTAAAARDAAEQLATAGERLADTGEGASERIAALSETVRAYEEGLEALREGLRRVAIRQQTLQDELDGRREDIAELLGTLQVMSRAPAPMLLLHPIGPLGTARGGLLAADVTPALQAEVAELTTALEEAAELRALQDSARRTLEEGLVGAQQARAELAEAASNREDLPRRFAEDPVKTALLIASTETLDAFASGLASVVDQELRNIIPDAAERKGTLRLPVQGSVLRGYGEADAAGTQRPGLVIAAAPRALVTSPAAATIRFQGPLLDYGNVVILEPAPDVLFVVAGLAEAFGQAGQVVPEGAPIGLMGGVTPSADAILSGAANGGGANRSETLYLEVREGQETVDPLDWFDRSAT
ncbi:murein hydrolase activator EnvC family protein [Wenxinia saemankumensis]|uniref:Septal ring factor EnvC, activator of murein hydrolases AmiA and AmiB n=1 Tax=Wenxinia saemankumensis TaxID=1447782 RepID=A0A1M6DZT1_9RHOB|nr:peptidoglycan DD-metalloendopeptidase family protein [Wenxinia saemankumensis]SHI78630.1 Septal ring factor EnvC, activator of murein hydrolases AmiA and AmiB [Wenxinia saemankumensis]